MSSSDLNRHSYKVVLVGSSGVGKTSIVQHLISGNFREENQATIGVEFKSYALQTEGESIKLQIWDTAGQERFRSVSKAYFRNALGAILVFDLTNRQSFDDLNMWFSDFSQLSAPNAYILSIGNKCDLEDERQIVESEANSFAQRNGLFYLETSAKNGDHIEEAFVRLGTEIYRKVKSGDIKPIKQETKKITAEQENQDLNNSQKVCC